MTDRDRRSTGRRFGEERLVVVARGWLVRSPFSPVIALTVILRQQTPVQPSTGAINDMSQVLRVSWYWFRATLAGRSTSYLMIILLVGAVGGIAIGSVVAADRTASSFNVFLKSTNPSDMSVVLYAPNLSGELSHLPLVRHVDTVSYALNPFPKGPNPAKSSRELMAGNVAAVGTLNGEYISQDKVAVVDGRTANPKKADEFVMTATAERLMGWHVGETIPMAFYTNAQVSRSTFNTAKLKPHLMIAMHLVGTVLLSNEVVSDEVNQFPALIDR